MAGSYPYRGGSRGVIPGPGEAAPPPSAGGTPVEAEPARKAPAKRAARRPASAATKPAQPAGEAPPADEPQDDAPASESGSGVGLVRDGGGFVLAALLWGWVILPYLGGGAANVKNVIRAKFTNKGPKGEWLP